jgi:hypothetical protein
MRSLGWSRQSNSLEKRSQGRTAHIEAFAFTEIVAAVRVTLAIHIPLVQGEARVSRVVAYIDGLNLYYGMRSRFGRTFHWLDIEELCKQLLRPHQHLVRINYFTALVPEPATSHARQSSLSFHPDAIPTN